MNVMMDQGDLFAPAVLTTKKALLLFGLGTSTLLAADIGDPQLERYVSLGVGGLLAATIFYFYRQLSEQSIARERENARLYSAQADKMMTVLQENSRINATLIDTATNLNATVVEMNREQRERYEADIRGRRSYDK